MPKQVSDWNKNNKVLTFMKAMQQAYGIDLLNDWDHAHVFRVAMLEKRLIDEEAHETSEALSHIVYNLSRGVQPRKQDVVELLDGLADLVYVVMHCANAFGLDLVEAFDRVHESNMSKLDEDGNPVRDAGGKVTKSARYKPVNLEDLV